MSSKLATWIKSKLDSIEDVPTPSDWEAMEQMINAQPSLIKLPWYKTIGGIASITGAVAIVVGSTLYLSPQNDVPVESVPTEQDWIGGHDLSTLSPPSSESSSLNESNPSDATGSSSESATHQEVSGREESVNTDVAEASHSASSSSLSANPTSIVNSEQVNQAETDRSVVHPVENESASQTREEFASRPSNSSETVSSNSNSSVLREERGSELLSSESQTNSQDPAISSESQNTSELNSGGEGSSLAAHSGQNSSSSDSNSEGENSAEQDKTNSEDNSSNQVAETDNNTSSESDSNVETQTDEPSSTPSPIISRPGSQKGVQWSVNGYADFSTTTTSVSGNEVSPGGGLNQTASPFGFGLEATASYNSWTVSSGVMIHRENFNFERKSSYTTTDNTFTSWYEVDTLTETTYDSTWVITGINQGEWRRDTTITETYYETPYERFDSSTRVITTVERRRVEGYRVSVPFLFGKEWDWGKWRTAVQAGPLVTLASASWYEDDRFIETRNQWGTDLMLRAELGYEFINRFEVFSRIGFRINATDYQNLRRPAWSNRSIPIALGLRYQF